MIAILASLVTPSLGKVMSNAVTTHCKVNLKNVYQSTILYGDDYDGYLPGPCRGNAEAYFYREINYRNGIPARRNQRLSSYLAPYIENKSIDHNYNYIPSLICPASSEEESPTPLIFRSYYNILKINGIGNPFGLVKRRRDDGSIREMKLSMALRDIVNPSDHAALKDLIDKDKKFENIPDFPVHPEFLENNLFYDGRVESYELVNF